MENIKITEAREEAKTVLSIQKSVQEITVSDLASKLVSGFFDGCTFIGFDSLTSADSNMNKRGNPFYGRTQKVAINCHCMLFTNKLQNGYQNMVNRRLQSEGKEANFEVSRRKWGERIKGTPIIKHTKKGEISERLYLETIFLSSPTVSYLVDGKPIKSDLLPLKKREEGKQGGLSKEEKVIIRTYALENITRISFDGDVYIVKPD